MTTGALLMFYLLIYLFVPVLKCHNNVSVKAQVAEFMVYRTTSCTAKVGFG